MEGLCHEGEAAYPSTYSTGVPAHQILLRRVASQTNALTGLVRFLFQIIPQKGKLALLLPNPKMSLAVIVQIPFGELSYTSTFFRLGTESQCNGVASFLGKGFRGNAWRKME